MTGGGEGEGELQDVTFNHLCGRLRDVRRRAEGELTIRFWIIVYLYFLSLSPFFFLSLRWRGVGIIVSRVRGTTLGRFA